MNASPDIVDNSPCLFLQKLSRSAKKPRQLHIVSVSAPDDDTGAMLTDSDSEDGDSRTRGSEEMMEYGTSHGDIYNDSGWDTDLEIEGKRSRYCENQSLIKYRIKPEELYILSCGNGQGLQSKKCRALRVLTDLKKMKLCTFVHI